MVGQADWQKIRKEYEAGASLRSLARKHGISKTYLIEKRDKEQWHRPDRPTTDNSGHTTLTRDVNATVRVHTAIKLYLEERPTWDEIAARCGYGSRGAAHHAVMRELDRCITHDVKALRTEDLYMLQRVQARCYEAAIDKQNKDWTWAVDRFVAVAKRKAELMGEDVKPDELPGVTTVVREVPTGFLSGANGHAPVEVKSE